MRAALVGAVLLGLAAAPVEGAPLCSDGRFDVAGAPLLTEGPPDTDAIVLDLPRVSIESGCERVKARLRRLRQSIRLRARWRTCAGGRRPVRLNARIDRLTCGTLDGTLRFGTGRALTTRQVSARRVMPGAAPIIPRPAVVWEASPPGVFVAGAETAILVEPGRPEVAEIGTTLAGLLAPHLVARSGVAEQPAGEQPADSILLTTTGADPDLGREGYQLVVTPARIVIRAPEAAGLFYGVQSLRQLLPTALESPGPVAGVEWTVPALRIEDAPRFPWRGFMLDVSRAFFPKEFLLRYVDLLALHKLNVFHLHLTDDQGWRIEIDAHPELHLLGSRFDAVRFPDERGGYFTKEELREVVAYAASRHVQVVPEIDMPGHSLAALHAMPELACTSSPDQVRTADEFPIIPWLEGPLIHEEVLCACDERVYAVLEAVLDEVAALFPGRYLHVGGDEVPKTEWESSHLCQALVAQLGLRGMEHVQAYFTKRVEDLLRARGKVLVAWDETLVSEAAGDERTRLSPDATFMHWRDFFPDPPSLYARGLVRTPFTALYLDYDSVSLEQTYRFEPVPATLTPDQVTRVLGAQGNMWTGFPSGRSEAGVDRHVFPRLLAIAELAWTPGDQRDFSDFEARRGRHTERLDRLGVVRGQ